MNWCWSSPGARCLWRGPDGQATPRPKALGRRPTAGLAEGPASTAILQREGSYRRILALADMLVAALVLFFIAHLTEAADFSTAMLVTLPLIVVVNKVCGLYERDELVLKKSTLDEVPMLLQIAGLFALILWLIHDGPRRGEPRGARRRPHLGSTFGSFLRSRALARAAAARASSIERCLVVGDEGAIDKGGAQAHRQPGQGRGHRGPPREGEGR